MKRPKLWNISFIGIIWICLIIDVNCLKATSLIFAKTTTTTTTTDASVANEHPDGESTAPESGDVIETETKPTLTGIPQIDYKFDPNLPRELNGYNLTDYPFYSSVPPLEEINFTCDGLHDGFYASIPHKCQVYHHCLFGTRYDFLCANYTAFDQKTFICHFASEVDCANSAKYFSRNDALYQAATTTTAKPTTTTTQAPVTQATAASIPPSGGGRKPGYSAGGGYRRRRPPYRRRRPYDYYDDELEDYSEEYYDDEPPRSRVNRKKPMSRPNRRPESVYEEYDDEYDTRYDRRGSQDRRRPINDRRRPYDDRRRPENDRKRVEEDRQYPLDEEDRRKPTESRHNKQPEDIDVEERRSFDDGRRRPVASDDYDRRPSYNERRKPQRRPYDDEEEDFYDRKRPSDDNDRRYRPVKEDRFEPEEPKVQIKPISSSSIFSKPRAPPIIRRPVPANERDKYDYTTKSNPPSAPAIKDEEYYDEYEDEPPVVTKPRPTNNRKPVEPPPRYGNGRPRPSGAKLPLEEDDAFEDEYKSRGSQRRPVYRDDVDAPYREEPKNRNKKRPATYMDEERPVHRKPISEDVYPEDTVTNSKRRPLIGEDDDRPVLETTSRFRKPSRPTTTIKPRSTSTERRPDTYDEEYYDEPAPLPIRRDENEKPKSKFVEDSPPVPEERSTTTSRPEISTKREPYKIVRRPFLPSRGGNPLAARGLQPVGSRAQETTTSRKLDPPTTSSTTTTSEKFIDEVNTAKYNTNFKTRGRFTNPGEDNVSTTHNSKYEYITDTSSEQAQDEDYPSGRDSNYKTSDAPTNIKVNLRSNYNVGGGRNFGETGPSGNFNLPNKASAEESKPFNQNSKSNEQQSYSRNTELTSFEETNKPKDYNRGTTHYTRPANSYRIPEITTSKPKDITNAIKNPLDLIENEYDVTLNDALNPTIPNIPNRNSPSGFILPREPDYTFSTYNTRPRYNYEPLNQASTFTYQIQDPITNTNNRNVAQYQASQFIPNYQQPTNYNTRTIRQQYTTNF